MRRKTEISREAENDLGDIADFLCGNNERSGLVFFEKLEKCIADIADFPERFARIPRYMPREIRKCVFGAYLIFYVFGDERVTIIRVLHGAQDYEAMLFGDPD